MRGFENHYEFQPGRDVRYSIFDVTPAEQNRAHEHAHVERGLDAYTANWECVARSNSRRRGSDRLYLVDDSHYIHCSRTGMEQAGNCVRFSKNPADDLVFSVISSVFEGVVEQHDVSIQDGVNREQLFDGGTLTIHSPNEVVLANECTQAEIESYYEDIADLFVSLISRYHDADTVDKIQSAVEWYRGERTDTFRDYIGFSPTVLSTVVNDLDPRNGWHIPENIDAGKRDMVLIHGDSLDAEVSLFIDVGFDERIALRATDGMGASEGRTLAETTYESADELRRAFLDYMNTTPADVVESRP